MESLTGEFRITLDDKGRLSLPVRLRNALADTTLFLTKGMDDCLWLFPSNEWKEMLNIIMDGTTLFSSSSRTIRRQLIGPSQEEEIDKAGRIPVPQTLREFAGLSKECVVLGQFNYIEIWSDDRYQAYLEAHKQEFLLGTEELGNLLKKNKDLSK
jgi:MraZ protein